MKKRDILVIGTLLLIALALYGVRFLRDQGMEGNRVVIEVNGKVFAQVPLDKPQTVTVSQPSGAVNVVEITRDGAVMASSTCDNQTCIHQGMVTLDNFESRPTQGFIICLPNRVTVELIPGAKK